MAAQHELAQAQAQAQQRALTVAREKAANEAKSEFMSLMCHEVRTPLNGCLASAEMLLDTALEVCLCSFDLHFQQFPSQYVSWNTIISSSQF